MIVDRLYIHGDAERGQKRGIALNSASTTITGSYISDIKLVGQDSQAICGWNGPGPYTIANNYLEAAGENIMFGGSDPTVPNLVPADIVIADNYITKPLAWRAEKWSAKNLIELKNARRVLIAGNTLENNWEGGQPGFAIVFTVRNQNGRCPWCQVDHVTFERNIVRHIAAGIKILGWDNNHPSQQTQRDSRPQQPVLRRRPENVGREWLLRGDDGRRAGHHRRSQHRHPGERALASCKSTVRRSSALSTPTTSRNPAATVFPARATVPVSPRSAHFCRPRRLRGNVIAGAPSANYPAGNSCPSVAQFETQFIAFGDDDYRLIADSPWRGAGSDGQDLGAFLGPAT